jgi:hypothetical protein
MKQFIFFPFRLIVLKNLKTVNIIEDWAFNADLSPEEIEKERGVVLEEYRIGLGEKRMLSRYLPKMIQFTMQIVCRLVKKRY